MKSAITLISAAHAAVAMASFVAVRGVSRTLDGMAREGGGITAYSESVANAARWPMIAAGVAVVVSLGVSTTMIVTLRNLSAMYEGASMGNSARLRELQRLP